MTHEMASRLTADPSAHLSLSEGDGRDQRIPASLAAALRESSDFLALPVCSQCRASVPEAEFVRYVFDFSFERDPALRPDPIELERHGEGECQDCWDGQENVGFVGTCERCGRVCAGHKSHCRDCRGRVR
jgi:hypothetical protein